MQQLQLTIHVSFPAVSKEDYDFIQDRAVKIYQGTSSRAVVEAVQCLKMMIEKYGENYRDALDDNYEPEYITELKHMIKNIKAIEPEKSSQEIANDIFEISEKMELGDGMIE